MMQTTGRLILVYLFNSRDTRSRGKGFAANLPHLLRLFFMAMVFILFIFLNGVYLLAAHRQRYDDRIAALFLLSNTDPRVPATVQPVVQVAASALAARQIQSTTDSNGNTTRPLTIEDVKNSKSLAGWIITIHLGTIYFSRILVLASKEINDYTNAGWKRRDALSSMLFRKLARFVNRNHLQVGTSPSPATYSNSLVEASSPEFRYDLYKELAAQHDISPEISWFFRNTHTGREIKTTFSNCFVNDLLWLVFVLFQAVTRVILCWTSFRHLKKTDAAGGGAAMKWGIGQIMPMIMVLLPILSWIAITVNTTTTTATTATTSSTSSSSASSISIVAATGTGSLALPTRSAAVQSSSTSGSSSMPVPVGTDDGSSNPAAADSLNNTTLSEHHRTPNSTRDTNMRMPPFVSPQAVHDIELRTWVLSHNIIFPFYISLKVICLFTIFSSVLLVIFQILVDDQLSILGPPNAQATLKHEYGITGIIYGSTVFLLILGPLRVIWSFLLQTYTDFQYLRRKRDKRPKRPKPLRSEAERSRQRCEQVKNLGLIVAELRDSVGARAQRDLDATRERLTEGKAALEQLEAEMRASESVLADLSRLEFRPELEFFVDVLSGWDVVLERYDKEVAEGRDRGGLEEETFRCDTGGRGLFGSRFG